MDALGQDLLPRRTEKNRNLYISLAQRMCSPILLLIKPMHTAPHCQPKLVFMSCAKQYEIQVGTSPPSSYKFNELLGHINEAGDGNHDINYEDIDFIKAREATNDAKEANNYFRRLIEHPRKLYRPDDLGAAEDDPMDTFSLLERCNCWP